MFRQIQIDLGQGYGIYARKGAADTEIEIKKNHEVIGKARLTTDNIDVSCITTIYLHDEHINQKFHGEFTLGEIVIKFLLKFPSVVRKPEFRFILDVPENLKETVDNHDYNRIVDPSLKSEILIRPNKSLPQFRVPKDEITFKQAIDEIDQTKLLSFLQKNAYWQSHLTLDRLKILIDNSQCFFAFSDANEIVGFARVVTDNIAFASLWDVAVDEKHRRRGIGMSLMFNIFTHETLSKIDNWVLFTDTVTDTAKGLYQKFGFVSEEDVPNRKLVHKLRPQEAQPVFMLELIEAASCMQSILLNPDQAFQFLFGKQGKRKNLSQFWKSVSTAAASAQQTSESISRASMTY
jgi:ribosomal protein S18 acetylase RimI-like enzyme